jgi:prepilin-type N-terminal cleavage/methylation domain-containing protein
MICHGQRVKQRGFTLIELSFFVAIIAILAAIALPFYRDYAERAHLAEVLVQYDAMREKAQIAAQEGNRDLCNWTITWSGRDKDAETATIETIVNNGIKALDPGRWKPPLNHFTSAIPQKQAAAPLTVQFGGTGAQGVARTRLLAAEFQKTGAFNKWERDSAVLASFTVFLGPCKTGSVPSTVVASAVTQSPRAAPPAPTCTTVQQPSADGTSCVPKVCGKGLVLDPASGACNPGCKPDEYEPVFIVRGGFPSGFDQPKTGPYTCFSRATEACPADRTVPGVKDGALVCEPAAGSDPAIMAGPKPTGCAVGAKLSNPFTEASLAQKLSYKAFDCGGQDPSNCDFMASPAGAVTCAAGSFPSLKLVNNVDGTRTYERSCMSAAQCKADWWNQTSASELCRNYNPGKSETANFQCTWCCAGDNCNGFDLNPDGNRPDANDSVCGVNPALLVRW